MDRCEGEEDGLSLPEEYKGVTSGDLVAEDVNALRRNGIVVELQNEPAPEDEEKDDSSGAGSLWGFKGVDQWRRDGNAIFSKAKLKHHRTTIDTMSALDIWLVMFPIDFLEEVVIPQTNKKIKGEKLTFGEFIRWIGMWELMSCFVGIPSRRDWWSTQTITVDGGAPFRLNTYMSRNRFENILNDLTYTDKPIPSYKDGFFFQRQMEDAWNANMMEEFEPSWISVLDESIQEWFNRWSCPGWMWVPRKPHPFGNERHTIACGLSGILFWSELVEGKDRPKQLGKLEFQEMGNTTGTMLRCTKPIWNMGKVVVMDSGFCVVRGICELMKRGVYSSALIKKRRYWPKDVPGEEIREHFDDMDVAEVDALPLTKYGVNFHVWGMKEPEYVMMVMSTYGRDEALEGSTTKRTYTTDSGEVRNKQFSYHEVFGNHFRFRHQVDDHNNRRHQPISLERTWGTKFWPDRCFAHFLALTEVNVNLMQGYSEGKAVMPQIEFRRKLAFQMLENTLDDDSTIACRLKKKRKSIGSTHSLVQIPPHRGRWMTNLNKYNKTKQKYQRQPCVGKCGNRVRTHCMCNHGLFLCVQCFPEHLLDVEN